MQNQTIEKKNSKPVLKKAKTSLLWPIFLAFFSKWRNQGLIVDHHSMLYLFYGGLLDLFASSFNRKQNFIFKNRPLQSYLAEKQPIWQQWRQVSIVYSFVLLRLTSFIRRGREGKPRQTGFRTPQICQSSLQTPAQALRTPAQVLRTPPQQLKFLIIFFNSSFKGLPNQKFRKKSLHSAIHINFQIKQSY